MAEAHELDDYGGEMADAEPVADPQTELAAAFYNRNSEDTAHLTRTGCKARVQFTSTTWAGAKTYAASEVTHSSQWGLTDAQKPTVQQTAQGLYTLTWAATYTDALGNVETVNIQSAVVRCFSSDALDNFADSRQLTVSGNVVTIVTKVNGAAADVGNNSGVNYTIQVDVS